MIERYFIMGLRLNWLPPKDATGGPMDGAIIDNPLLVTNPMTYDGMDGELVGLTHVKTLGLTKGQNIPYRWLAYAPGRTTRMPLAGGDILTGQMSGCLIATWTAGGVQYAGHVGTINGNRPVNQLVKRAFDAANFQNLSAFNPAAAWNPGEIAALMGRFKTPPLPSVYALVTTGGAFFSILMFSLTHIGVKKIGNIGYERCVGGIKSVPPMTQLAITQKLNA